PLRALTSFPTRRSSDLQRVRSGAGSGAGDGSEGPLYNRPATRRGPARPGGGFREAAAHAGLATALWRLARYRRHGVGIRKKSHRSEEHTSELQSLAYLV